MASWIAASGKATSPRIARRRPALRTARDRATGRRSGGRHRSRSWRSPFQRRRRRSPGLPTAERAADWPTAQAQKELKPGWPTELRSVRRCQLRATRRVGYRRLRVDLSNSAETRSDVSRATQQQALDPKPSSLSGWTGCDICTAGAIRIEHEKEIASGCRRPAIALGASLGGPPAARDRPTARRSPVSRQRLSCRRRSTRQLRRSASGCSSAGARASNPSSAS